MASRIRSFVDEIEQLSCGVVTVWPNEDRTVTIRYRDGKARLDRILSEREIIESRLDPKDLANDILWNMAKSLESEGE